MNKLYYLTMGQKTMDDFILVFYFEIYFVLVFFYRLEVLFFSLIPA